MSNATTDAAFSGSIPKIYEQFLVPLIFQFYADNTAKRIAALSPSRVLESAAGTGVLTRAMADRLPNTTTMVSTDLNPAMLNEASSFNMGRPVEWKQADATQLPFDDASFDVVTCQFGVMFFPDRPQAYAEVRRVLRAGGTFVFSVWGSLDDNEIADEVARALSVIFPQRPPAFLQRTPYGYHSQRLIADDLQKAGFTAVPKFDVIAARAVAPNNHAAAAGFCQGTPLRLEIEALEPAGIGTTTEKVAHMMERRFGKGKIDTKMQATIVTITT